MKEKNDEQIFAYRSFKIPPICWKLLCKRDFCRSLDPSKKWRQELEQDFYIRTLSNDMKIDVQKNHLGGQILYRLLDPSKKRRH